MTIEKLIPYSDGDSEIHFEYKGRFYQTTKSWIARRMEETERIDITAQWQAKEIAKVMGKLAQEKELERDE